MFNKTFWIGVTLGLTALLVVTLYLFKQNNPGNVASNSQPVASLVPLNQTLEEDVSVAPASNPSLESKSTTSPIAKPTTKPTVKPTPQATPTPTPTPTPKPVIDYYLSSHSIVNQLDHSSNSEFVESASYPQIEFYGDFKVNNASAGDSVLYRVYEDGNLQESAIHNVFSTSNFTFSDHYYAKSRSVGSHTVKMIYNEDRRYPENNYGNNEYTFTFKILKESTPPTFTIDGPTMINGQTCLRWINLQDNKSVYTDVWAKWKIDGGEWSGRTSENPYGCTTGAPGSSHTYTVHAEDFSGNVKEESKTFIVY